MNKKVLILPIVGSFLLSGCKLNLFGKTIYLFEKPENNQDTVIIDDKPAGEETIEITSLSATPNAPFYLKVGETRSISVSPSPTTGVDPEKKIFEWAKSNSNIELVVDENNTTKATVKGLVVGTTQIDVTNTYNESLTKSFTAKVINFDEENEYLWEFSDRKPFGYNQKEYPQGYAEGVASLNGMDWEFSRKHTGHFEKEVLVDSYTINATLEHTPVVPSSIKGAIDNIEFIDDGEGNISGTAIASGSIDYETGEITLTFEEPQSGKVAVKYDCIEPYTSSLYLENGGVTFGKSEDPETHIHFETANQRAVEKIIIEASSYNAQGKMTIKVGDTVYMDNKTVPRDYYDVIQTISCEKDDPASGNISIDIETPEMDINAATDSSYRKPGAFCLKSIWIKFAEEHYVGIDFAEDSKHKVDYIEDDTFTFEGMKLDKISERGFRVPVNMSEVLAGDNPKLTHSAVDFSEASHEAKTVELSLKVGEDQVFTKSFDIHVRSKDWVPEKLEVKGSLNDTQELIAGDVIDYSNLSIDIVYDTESSDIRHAEFKESSELAFSYGEGKDPFVAEVGMEGGFTIEVTGSFTAKASKVSTTFVVPSNMIKVTASIYDRIDYERIATFKEIDDAGLTTSTGALSYKTGKNSRVRLDFNNAVKRDRVSDKKTLVGVNAEFRLTVLDKTLSIKEIQVEFALANSNDNKFRLSSSIYGGDIYGSELCSASNQHLEFAQFEAKTNNLRFLPELASTGALVTGYICIQSILVRYEESAHVEYTISKGETTPTTMDYMEGDKFNPAGLTVTLNEVGSENSYNIISFMKWYDGATYSEAPQETLTSASTYVVGVFHDKTIQVEIGTVAEKKINIEKVTSLDQISEDGKYYITCPSIKLVLLGSTKNSDIFKAVGARQYSDLDFGDQIAFDALLENEYMLIHPQEDGTFIFETRTGANFGLTESGGGDGTAAQNRPYTKFIITIGEGGVISASVTANLESGDKTFYLGCNTTNKNFKLYSDDKANVVLYKVVA